MKKLAVVVSMLMAIGFFYAWARPVVPPAAPSGMAVPEYDKSGALVRPKNFDQWTFVGSNIGMSYSAGETSGPGEFHNIHTQPQAYAQYAKTGTFPEKTMFLLAVYEPAQKVSINKSGYFEGPMAGLAVSVKDHEHFKEGWAYFSFGEGSKLAESAQAMAKPMCYDCHAQHADQDNVFVQFHTVLRSLHKNDSHPTNK